MRTTRWLTLMGLTVLLLGVGVAQTPTLVLTNGDVNGDNAVDDTDRWAVLG